MFHARLAGADIATGDYICFVDSDDSISIDWIRLLVKKARNENADMVLANTVQHNDERYYIENNYRSLCFNRPTLTDGAIFDVFMKDAGYDFAWHTVWNKLYSMDLWRQARPEYDALKGHLIMAEDIIYSLVLYYYSRRMAFSDHDAYYYYRNDQASTSASTISLERIAKYIDDISRVFQFFERFLKKHGLFETYRKEFEEYKDRNFRIQSNILYARDLKNNKKYVDLLCRGFGKKAIELSHPDDFYFYDVRTTYQGNELFWEKLSLRIADPEIDVISFDLFDTLVKRPFTTPDRLNEFIERKYKSFLTDNKIRNFIQMRKEAENTCRNNIHAQNPLDEDCTLSEIYTTFAELYGISPDIADILKANEEDTDLEVCRPRTSIVDLIELAKTVGKTVIITTDTYYDKEFLIRLLAKCNVKDYDAIFASGERRRLKATGTLYECVKKAYPDKTILHIGDNWNSDILMAQQAGLRASFVPNTREISTGIHYDNYVGEGYLSNQKLVLSFADVGQLAAQLPLNACYAASANRMFDRPFPTWNNELRYNSDAYFIGNYVFGTEMLGLSTWLYSTVKNNGYKRLVFLARDGYVPMIAFKTYLAKRGYNDVEVDYFNVSRRSLIPIAIEEASDLGILQDYVEYSQHTPLSLVGLFPRYFDDTNAISAELTAAKITPNDRISNASAFVKTINVLNAHFDFNRLATDNKKVRTGIKKVFSQDTIAFDLGYSGRIQTLLCKTVGYPIDVCFLHSNGFDSVVTARDAGFKKYEYLSFTPKITSIIREYFFSEIAPSCIGYSVDGDQLTPLFDSSEYSYIEHFIQEEIIRGMTDFLCDYCEVFAPYDFMFFFRNEEMSLPFENFINDPPEKDLWMFRCCSAEDMLYYNYAGKSLYDIWLYNLRRRNNVQYPGAPAPIQIPDPDLLSTPQFLALPRWKRALVLLISDKKLFKQKLKNNINKRKKKQ